MTVCRHWLASRRAATFLLAVTALALSARAGHAQALHEMKSRRTPHYELYAPTEDAVRDAAAQLDHAVERFRRVTGAEAAGLAVIVMDDPGNAASFSTVELANRGLRVLPWFTRAGLGRAFDDANVAPGALENALEKRVLSHEACHAFLFHLVESAGVRGRDTRAAGTGSYGHPDVPDWLDETVAVACESAAGRAERIDLLRSGQHAPIPLGEFLTMQHPLGGSGAVRLTRTLPGPDGAAAAADAAALSIPARGAHLRRPDGTTVQLDSAAARAWLDSLQLSGARIVRSASAPGADPPPNMTVSRGARVVSSADIDPATHSRGLSFYAQAAAFATYLEEAEGEGVLRRFIDAAIAGQPSEAALAGLNRLPRTAAALEESWRTWLRTGSRAPDRDGS